MLTSNPTSTVRKPATKSGCDRKWDPSAHSICAALQFHTSLLAAFCLRPVRPHLRVLADQRGVFMFGTLRAIVDRPLLRQAVKFAKTTLASASLTLGLPVLLVEAFDLQQKTAVLVGFVCAYFFNIIVLRYYVFGSRNSWLRDFVKYAVANGIMRILEFGSFVLLAEKLSIHYVAAILIVLCVGTVTKFFLYREVFRS